MITYYTSPIVVLTNASGIMAAQPDIASEGMPVNGAAGTKLTVVPVFYGATEVLYRVETE